MRRHLVLWTILATAATAVADPAASWRRGDMAEALAEVRARLAEAPDDVTARLWLQRLTADPAELDLEPDPAAAAGLALARGDAETLAALLAAPGDDPPSGAVLLAAGLDARRRGDVASARDRLATVRPEAPEYAWARYHLARIAMGEGDVSLAQRYLDTADAAPRPVAAASVLAARWELVHASDPQAGRRLERELAHRFPRSNALARVRELQRRDRELAAAGEAAADPSEETAAPAVDGRGRYGLQFAAFTDRGRAMTFRDAWRDHIPDLAIVTEHGAGGAPVYRLRSGRFATRDQAETAAERIRRRHGLDVLVVELADSP